jgi:transposase
VLEAQGNKTDRNDARGIAQMMRDRPVPPGARQDPAEPAAADAAHNAQAVASKMLELENDLRGTLKNFGFKVGKIGAAGFEGRVRELVPVLVARAALREQFKVLHALLLRLVRHDRACRPLMTAPAVGPVAAMTFRATIDLPARFRKSKAIGAHFGLTPRRHHLAR